MRDYETEDKIRRAMIDAAGVARLGGEYVGPMGVEILESLSPIVGGWLPQDVVRESGKIIVHQRGWSK